MDHETIDRYLDRIGLVDAARRPSVELLHELQVQHLRTVPFENLSIHLGEPIELDQAALIDKIIDRHRGGFCYELNGAFAALLHELGFNVTLLSGAVFASVDRLGPPMDHLVLRVELDEPWLVDVGFGRHSHYPLRLDSRAAQPDPDGTYSVADTVAGDVDVLRDGRAVYRVELHPRVLADFVPTCWWHQTSPSSHFTKGPTCSMLTARGRITLAGNRLIETTRDTRSERELPDDEAILRAYRTHFGIELDRTPTVPVR